MRVAIHQPNFMPWLGLFHRLARVGRFVVFDHVQAMGGRSWLSRNRIMVGGEAHWLTVPVRKAGRLGQRIDEVEIDHSADFGRKHLRTLELSYRKAPHAAPVLEMLADLYGRQHRLIADFNLAFTRAVCAALGLRVEFLHSSALAAADPSLAAAAGNELVLRICQAAGADEYVSGSGCLDFIRPESFEAAGIAFHFQRFDPPVYPQQGSRSFVSHLSVVDALCNLGPDGVRALIDRPGLERPCPGGLPAETTLG
ncbi:MAG TPA: WbqC family protein [Azospirillaceae bacterium]|nr:WbqC family protein [Azospirillaceae bacterium]